MGLGLRTFVVVICLGATAEAEVDLSQIEDVEDLSLAELLEHPIVSASRYEQNPASSPMLVSSVDADQFATFGYQTLGDALRSMRGVYTSNDRNYSYIGARGFAVPGDYNTRFAMSIDGHRINDPVYGAASVGLDMGIPLIAIDRVELLRGGAWSVYGQNALLGAINVITATGESRPGLDVRTSTNATAETYGDPAGRAPVAPRAQQVAASYGAVGGGYNLFVAANYQYDPGLGALYMPELASDERSCVDKNRVQTTCDGIVHGSDAEEAGSGYLALRSKHLTFFTLATRRRKEVPTASYDSIVGDPIETFDDRIYTDAAFRVRRDRSDLDAHIGLDYFAYRGDYPYDYVREGYPQLPQSYTVNKDSATNLWATGELRGRYKWAKLGRYLSDAEVAVGGETQLQYGGQYSYYPLPEGDEVAVDHAGQAETYAVTAHAMARAFDHVVGFVAGRADYYPDSFGLIANPQLGMVIDLGEQGRIRGSLSRGFRAPNLYELYFVFDRSPQRITLEPERSRTAEVSYERYLGKNVRLLAVGYTQRITDLLALTTNDDDIQLYTNQGTSRGQGLELEVEGRWESLQLRASYARQRSLDENDQKRVNSPRSLAVATAIVPIGNRARLGVETNYVGSRLTLAGTAIAPVFLTTTSLTVPDIATDLDLTVGIRNLFDARTADPGSEEHVQSQIPSDPRTVWLTLTARLGRTKRGAP